MKVLIIGRSGQVARALARRASAAGHAVETIGRPEFDLERPNDACVHIGRRRPDVVINAAAYTAVDQAESERTRAFAVNASAAGDIARAAGEVGAPIVHVSTDYVFSGEKPAAYVEDDATGPTGAYGASKLEGERLVQTANARALIVRTAWVFDAEGANFVRTMLRLAKTRDEVGVVDDQKGCPTYAPDLADAIIKAAETITRGEGRFGVYHCAGGGETNWADFAKQAFALSAARGGPTAMVRPITTSDYPTLAKRPANSRLDCAKLARDYGVRMRPWTDSLTDCVEEIAAGGWRVE